MGFQNIAGLRGVVGAIDGTHIRISRPHVNEEVYVNRKGYHSINVQVRIIFFHLIDPMPKERASLIQ